MTTWTAKVGLRRPGTWAWAVSQIRPASEWMPKIPHESLCVCAECDERDAERRAQSLKAALAKVASIPHCGTPISKGERLCGGVPRMSACDVVIAAMDETAAEKQLTQWQATILVWGGLSWGPTNQLLLDAAIDYLSDCRDARRDAIAEFARPHCGNRTLTGDHHAVCDCLPPTEPAPLCANCTSPVCVCGVGRCWRNLCGRQQTGNGYCDEHADDAEAAAADLDLLDVLDDPHDHCGPECCG